MRKLRSWIKAFRLRTLPLALASIFMGSILAISTHSYNSKVIILAIVTTLFLQILSNLANDYGDGVKGTDNKNRIGPERSVQSGEITAKEMRNGIIVFVLLSLIAGIWLIISSLGNKWILGTLFLMLGVGAIAASIKYTVGKNAYGYSGYGDLSVFIFFGPVAVLGTCYLASKSINLWSILPAISMGLFSSAVLNINNMRDMENDAESGKNTFALILGYKYAKFYHLIIIITAMSLLLAYSIITYESLWQFIYILIFPIIIKDIISINKIIDKSMLDPFLKKLALSTFTISVLFGVGILLGS